MSVLNTGLAKTLASSYELDQSLRFNDDDSAYLSKTPAGASNQKTWTWSGWVKRSNLSLGTDLQLFSTDQQSNPSFSLFFTGTDTISYVYYDGTYYQNVTDAAYRDCSSWYHVVFVFDTTQAVAANRYKLYVNGSLVTSYASTNYPPLNTDGTVNNSQIHYISKAGTTGTQYLDGYLAEVHFIDGTALTPSSFGESGDYGEWKPIEVTGLTYGTNGFYLDFSDSAALGDDAAGSNDWTVNNLVASDQMLDTPTNNFATYNPIMGSVDYHTLEFMEGNLKLWSNGYNGAMSTIPMSSGKWYCECVANGTGVYVGVVSTNQDLTTDNPHSWSKSLQYGRGHVGHLNEDNAIVVDSYGDTFGDGDIIGMALDKDADTLTFYTNNVAQPEIDLTSYNVGTDELLFSFSEDGLYLWVNFGQDSSFAGYKTAQGNQDGNGIGDFYYTPPTGFLALCTANLPTPAVIPSEHFNTVLYTGTGSNQDITGVGFAPDFVWAKDRTLAHSHMLTDKVRGIYKTLNCDNIYSEGSLVTALRSFGADGFSLGSNANINTDTNNYVAWNWKANGSGSANTDGDMAETVTVSANTDAGFSIVTYTGDGSTATVGHGLSKAPEFIIIKSRDSSSNWGTYYGDNTDYLELDNDAATADDSAYWNDTSPTADVFTVETHADVNLDDDKYIAYCFHSVDGYSKMGLYDGNNSTDGTFVYTGFRPAYVMIHAITAGQGWWIFDTTRDTDGNPMGKYLGAERNNSEYTGDKVDFVSNGFKWRHDDHAYNYTGYTYTYLAFAETPFKYANAR